VDVKRAAELYARGRTLRQIGAELGITETTVSDQLHRAGVTMRRGGPPAHPASTEQILELRDRGLSWNEVAKQVGMTRSGAWSRYGRLGRPGPHAWAVGSRFLPTRLTRTLRLVSVQPWLIISVEPHPG
jgi:predicted transcriptional regulator